MKRYVKQMEDFGGLNLVEKNIKYIYKNYNKLNASDLKDFYISLISLINLISSVCSKTYSSINCS